jgi:RTX calcium-binding nonapeptide repeat (4 copies)
MCLLAGVASATFQPTVLYQPPLLRALDFQLHDSVENTLVEPNGRFALAVLNGPTPPAVDPESDPGCGLITGGVTCPVAGLERVVVSLGAMNDTGRIDLGRHARRLKQRIIGGAGEDGLTGGRGTQRLLGGPDNDILQGGPGRDVLVGGPGDDACNGGPGRDVVRSC